MRFAPPQTLDLLGCSFLLSALPTLTHLPRLRQLWFSVKRCSGVSAAQLESALLLTAVGAKELVRLVACECVDRAMAGEVRQRVREAVRENGTEGVHVLLPPPGDDMEDSEDYNDGFSEEEEEEQEE